MHQRLDAPPLHSTRLRRFVVHGSIALVSMLVVSLLVTEARAGVALSYSAPEECPKEASFVTAVTERGASMTAPSVEGGLSVSVTKTESGYDGTLRVRHGEEGEWTARQVHGESCAEVVDALAVVTSMTLRDRAAPAKKPAAPAPTVPLATPAEEKPRLRATGQTDRLDVPVEKGTVRFRPAYTATGYAGATVGLVPGVVLPRFELAFSIANFVALPNGVAHLLKPIFRIRLSAFGPASHASSDGYATSVGGFAGGFQACSSPLYDTEGFVLLGCTGFSAGLVALGVAAPNGQEGSLSPALASVDFGVEATYNFSRFIHATLRLEGTSHFQSIAPLRPDGSEIFPSSLFSGSGLLGIGAHF
jgi:hypothetical protein